MGQTIVRFQDVSLGYGRRLVVEGLTLAIRRGEFLGIIGPNGAGKTTLLRGILGLIGPRAGCISAPRTLHYGYVMQRQFLDTQFPFTVGDVVRQGRFGRSALHAQAEAAERRFRGLEAEERSLADQEMMTTEGAIAVVRGDLRSLEAAGDRDTREIAAVDRRPVLHSGS